jgi:uncharacterized membrane protein
MDKQGNGNGTGPDPPHVPKHAVTLATSRDARVRRATTAKLAFQGTVGDARTLLIGIAGTMVTVIALLLGLTVVVLPASFGIAASRGCSGTGH